MKHLRLTLTITIILAALAFNSCSKGIPVIFNDLTMGFVSGDNEITTDAGLTYFLTSAPADFNAEFGSRIYASFEVEDCIDENSGKFYARLTSFQIPLTIVPTDISKGSTPEFDMDSWKDAVNVNSAWISGGYLNILATWLAHKNSGIEHKTALTYCGIQKDTVYFSLVHNSQGDGYYSSKDSGINNIVTINKMTTFPVQDYLPEGNAVIKLSWTWHKSDGQFILPQTENYSVTCSLAGAASAAPSTKATISPFTTLFP